MGIVINQTLRNSLSTYLGIVIGAVNTLWISTWAFNDDPAYFGFVQILLSSVLIISTFVSFGAPNIVLKYFSSFNEQERAKLFGFSVLLPLIFIGLFSWYLSGHEAGVAAMLTEKESDKRLLLQYISYLIPLSLFNIYFEIFSSFSQVHFKSILPNFLKEAYRKLFTSVILILYGFGLISFDLFVFLFTVSFFSQWLFLLIHLMTKGHLKISFSTRGLPYRKLLDYGFFGILTFGGSLLINRIDGLMISRYLDLESVAFYTIGFFIGSVISTPGKASTGIIRPILSKALDRGDMTEVYNLYVKSCITLSITAGWIFMLVWINVWDIYQLIPEKFHGGEWVVFYIALSRWVNMASGINGHIIIMSQYYRFNLWSNVFLIVLTVLSNLWLIPIYGITGAAMASALVMILDQIIRMSFVYYKFKIHPFNRKYFMAATFLGVCILGFYFFNPGLGFIVNILLKSFIATLVFGFLVYYFRLSPDMNGTLIGLLKKYLAKKS